MNTMKHRWIGTFINTAACLGISVFIIIVLIPAFWNPPTVATSSICGDNMKQIGYAIGIYLSDWDDYYPTNRPYISGRKLGPISAYVELSDLQSGKSSSAKPAYQHGVNWVEAVYPYLASFSKRKEAYDILKCPKAEGTAWPVTSDTAIVSYALNANLVERSEKEIRGAAKLMMLRELDRPTGSTLRPINNTTSTSKSRPISPFISSSDKYFGKTIAEPHGMGSNIVFADGHVKIYRKDYFPSDNKITKERCWDPKIRQWYNYGPGAKDVPAQYIRSIAITP